MPLAAAFAPGSWNTLPGWRDDAPLPAFEAFRRSAFQALEKPLRAGSLGLTADAFAPAFEAARGEPASTHCQARGFFERFFRPALVRPDEGRADERGTAGFVTGFFEPDAQASPVRTPAFTVPLLRRPADLVDVDEANRPPGLDPYLAFARLVPDGTLAEYHDRAAIEGGALAGRGLEIAWLADPVEAFFIHVQGAARLAMTDGTRKRVTYAAKSGQRFSGPGRLLAELGEIPPADVTMQAIRLWLEAHPNRMGEILHANRSYIFFREAPVGDPALGPIAAAKVPLTPGRSVAVDRLLHTFGTPFFIDAPALLAFEGKPFRRLMIAQDTGSAILGAARGDLFAGSGDAAGKIAGVVRHAADFHALVPRALAGAP